MTPELTVSLITVVIVALYAVLIHYIEPWYQRKRLTIFSVIFGVAIVGAMAELLFGVLYASPEWAFFRNRIIWLFSLSGAIMSVQQFVRWHQLHTQRASLVWGYFCEHDKGDDDDKEAA
jgi:uncharacterized protein involved in response to NO